MTASCPGRAGGNDTTPGLQLLDSPSSINRRVSAHKVPTKQRRVVEALLVGPLTTFQAEKAPVFDHCLPSTISELRKTGFSISARMITVAGYSGLPARIAEYTLASECRDRAAKWIGVQ